MLNEPHLSKYVAVYKMNSTLMIEMTTIINENDNDIGRNNNDDVSYLNLVS